MESLIYFSHYLQSDRQADTIRQSVRRTDRQTNRHLTDDQRITETNSHCWFSSFHFRMFQSYNRHHRPKLPQRPDTYPSPPAPGPPHGVEQRALLGDAQQLIGHGHVVGHWLFAVVKEGVRRPDLTGHQIVEPQDGHWPLELEPLVLPALPKEHVDGVLLLGRRVEGWEGV